MKHKLYVWLGVFVIIPALLFALRANAVINASRDITGNDTIVFGNITAADTTESIKTLDLFRYGDFFESITYFVKITSRRHAGIATTDSVQFCLVGSVDDSTFQNVSTTGETVTVTGANISTDGLYSITFYDVKTFPFTRLRIFNLAAADSLTAQVKAKVSFREVR